jgi:hypothetical protein
MSRKTITYEVLLQDADGKVVDRYDNELKTPVKRVFNQLYVEHKFGGVTGQHERSTIAINEGTVSTNAKGWTLRITTTHGRSYIATNR